MYLVAVPYINNFYLNTSKYTSKIIPTIAYLNLFVYGIVKIQSRKLFLEDCLKNCIQIENF